MSFLKKLFGDYSTKEIKRISGLKDAVLNLEEEYSALSDEQLQAKTVEFKERLSKGETLDDILPEAFAACREAAWRVLGMKHYPVQILGGIILHQGRIAEMKTGEGKTLVATLPAYLNALSGKGVHIVTVNDYLAKRDSEWMGKIYRFMGLSVGLIIHDKQPAERKEAYDADITFGTNNEMGFDYLRDNMVMYAQQRVQRGHAFAIVDEVDSILIDEARTPLIISGMGEASTDLYKLSNDLVKRLKMVKVSDFDSKCDIEEIAEEQNGDYFVDEKAKSVTLTKSGIMKAEQYFHVDNLMDPSHLTLQHHINQALKAHGTMARDVDYVVKDGQVLIVDEFTGRIMQGRRYSEGLHQAIEAKENVKIENESKTLATITFQNYFRLYKKLSGMTGTAMTESQEFQEIYSLDVVEIPTNKPLARVDNNDVVYLSEEAKFNKIVEAIEKCHQKGQPVLVGTVNIEKSEQLSKFLKKRGIKHEVLNAKFHEKEAEIVAQAGKFGAVTIATNMAGRGTDIILGGNPEFMAKDKMRKMEFDEELIAEAMGFAETDNEDILNARKTFRELEAEFKKQTSEEAEKVRAAGGLCIIGTERHDSRRIDNQLRGRAGRQGDPGESVFYLSTDDNLFHLFGTERVKPIIEKLKETMLAKGKLENLEDARIDLKMVTNSIESAQRRVEGDHFAVRRNVLKFDDVMNKQREVIYTQRNQVLDGEDVSPLIQKMIVDTISESVDFYCPANQNPKDWNTAALLAKYTWLIDNEDIENLTRTEDVAETLLNKAQEIYDSRVAEYGIEKVKEFERFCLLRNVDFLWMDHIDAMDQLKRGMGLMGYGQKDPVIVFRDESLDMFEEMTDSIREGTVHYVLQGTIKKNEEIERKSTVKITSTSGANDGTLKKEPARKEKKPGRNDPCPCGSGKKYKKCCGQ
ncbi:MAG: preprotein translocase subunit SecA [Clostridia bacterium]|nr:preprotein translocase subunit SecA [Clostridia bacterium]